MNTKINKIKSKSKVMKKAIIYLLAFPLVFASCKKDDPEPEPEPEPTPSNVITVSSNITSNTTWETGKTYILASRITVTAGNTLTIQPGTVIKGQAGTGANATALIIARDANIMAQGTASQPIIFTSIADELEPGQIVSPNLDASFNGLWGGVIILGNAPISADATSVQIEGIPVSDPNGLFGGADAADNSGIFQYVSIRHGGANIGEGNEINGLTLGGVGSATTIDHVEIVGNQDDGVEFFGGSVNASNIIVWAAGDDGIDTDMAWSGTLDNFIVICDGSDHALEIDGPEGTLLDGHTLMNGSIKGDADAELGDFRESARGSFQNIYFFNFPDPAVAGRGDFSLSTGSDVTFGSGALTFSGLQTTLPSAVALGAVFKNGTDVHATDVVLGANTVGATKSNYTTWTWADADGQLTDFQ